MFYRLLEYILNFGLFSFITFAQATKLLPFFVVKVSTLSVEIFCDVFLSFIDFMKTLFLSP